MSQIKEHFLIVQVLYIFFSSFQKNVVILKKNSNLFLLSNHIFQNMLICLFAFIFSGHTTSLFNYKEIYLSVTRN